MPSPISFSPPTALASPRSVAIVGSGPAALMAAEVISGAGHSVTIFEKKKGPGRKLLVAGSSGLNITHSHPPDEFIRHYTGPEALWRRLLSGFPPDRWIAFIHSLGLETFRGTSHRHFLKDMKASRFLRAWLAHLGERGVKFEFARELTDFSEGPSLSFADEDSPRGFDAVCLCLGGGSWEPAEEPLRWPPIFTKKGLGFTPFTASNVGYRVTWPEAFLKEAEGWPIKNVRLTSARGSRMGDVVITRYGLEGTPVYFVGESGTLTLDLKPDLSEKQVMSRLEAVKENLSPIRRAKKQLALSDGAMALLFHCTPPEELQSLSALSARIKRFPVGFEGSQSLSEAISSAGGLHLSELDDRFMLRKFPGIFAAGEMLDWDAPTGGFLIQACVSQGFAAGQGLVSYLGSKTDSR